MANQDLHQKNRKLLINSVIYCVSNYGLEGLTTKLIAEYSHLNEAYIYRYFLDKNDLLKKAYLYLDSGFFEKLDSWTPILENENVDFKSRCYEFFENVLNFLLLENDKTRFYIRFYFSTLNSEDIALYHHQSCMNFVYSLKDYFPSLCDNEFFAHSVFHSVMYYVSSKFLEKDDNESKEKMFEVIYYLLQKE